jgi:integrase/recombinase XerD
MRKQISKLKPFRVTYRDKSGQKQQSKKYYIRVPGTRRSIALYESVALSRKVAAKIDGLLSARHAGQSPDAELQTWLNAQPDRIVRRLVELGFLDARRSQGGRGLDFHLQEWRQSMLAAGNTHRYAEQQYKRAIAILSAFRSFSDVSASKVQIEISKLRVRRRNDDELKTVEVVAASDSTQNYYLQACRQFFRWAVRDGRINADPLAHLTKKQAHKARRAALTADELRKLLTHTEAAGTSFGLTGYQRSILYRFAAQTGFRASEIRALRVCDFDLKGRTVTLAGQHTKNKKAAVQPLPADLCKRLKVYFAGKAPKAEAFAMPNKYGMADMLREDLDDADVGVDSERGIVDFHCLRHTYGSQLAAAGVHPKVAQTLMRHGTITLTMDLYTHSFRDSEVSAVDALPDLSAEVDAEQKQA